MKRTFLVQSSLFVLLITGCSSFNNSFNTYHFPAATANTGNLAALNIGILDDDVKPHTPSVINADNDRCKNYVYPVMGAAPELPLKEIIAANGNAVAIERIERKHIDDLRLFISKTRRELIEAQSEHKALCGQ
jgi:hypothetical protein